MAVARWSRKTDLGLPGRRRPKEVFTPAVPARPTVFTRREKHKLQTNVEEVLTTPGFHLVLYGETGVGKTSLVEYVCKQAGIRFKKIDCAHDQEFEPLLRRAIAELDSRRLSGQTEESSVGGSLGARGVSGTSTLSASSAYTMRERDLMHEFESVFRAKRYLLLFLDNFEEIGDSPRGLETKNQLLRLMKFLSDRDQPPLSGCPKIVIAGTSTATRDLLQTSRTATRRMRALLVPTMSVSELEQIISKGARQLRMRFDPEATSAIVRGSMGLPYYTHLLALRAVVVALDRSPVLHRFRTVTVTTADVELAKETAIDERRLDLEGWFEGACGNEREPFRPKQEILFTLADLQEQAESSGERRTETARRIRDHLMRRYPQAAPWLDGDFPSSSLRELEREGLVMRQSYAGRPDSYAISDPNMAGYLLLRMAREAAAISNVTHEQAVRELRTAGARDVAEALAKGILSVDEEEQRIVLSFVGEHSGIRSARIHAAEIELAVRAACTMASDSWAFHLVCQEEAS